MTLGNGRRGQVRRPDRGGAVSAG